MPLIHKYNSTPNSILKKCTGFTLLEVMISMVIFSISLLGLASLQGQSLQFSHGAYLKSQASFYAYDVLDKMRANRSVALAGNYNASVASVGTDKGCYSNTGNCSATDMALHDIYDWKQLLASLPDGNGFITSTVSLTKTVFDVTVTWTSSEGVETIAVRTEL